MTCAFLIIKTQKFWFLLLITDASVLWLANCTTGMKRKGPSKKEIIAVYELIHYNDYKTKIETYKNWPELVRDNLEENCRLYLSATFPRKDNSTTSSRVRNIFLFYKEIKDVIIVNESNSVELAALECEMLHSVNRRRYIQFIRSPTRGYVYLTNHLKDNIKAFIIAAEVYIVGGTDRPIKTREEYRSRKGGLNGRHNDAPEQQWAYEKEHHDDYYLNRESYEKWPELKTISDKNEHCQKLLKRILPKSDLSHTNFTIGCSTLGYPVLQTLSVMKLEKILVASLVCYTPLRANRNRFQFIRAAKLDCKYLVKQVKTYLPYVRITKQFCDDKEESHVVDRNEESSKGEDETAVDNYDDTFDIKDLPIDDVTMELI